MAEDLGPDDPGTYAGKQGRLLPEPDEEASTRSMDTELKIIGKLLRMLAEVELPARKRIMVYLNDRYLGGE